MNCSSSGLTLTFNKTQLDNSGRNYTIKFKDNSDAECGIDHGTTENVKYEDIWIAADYNKCGIKVSENGTNIVYEQTVIVTYGKDTNNDIQRAVEDEYEVKCQKSRNVTESLDVFEVEKTDGKTVSKG